MNQFFYESRGKERVKELMNEGLASQAQHRSRTSRASLWSKLPRFVLIGLGLLWIIQQVVR